MFFQPPFSFPKGVGEWGGHYDMHYLFSIKQNVKDIFADGHSKKKVIFQNWSKKLKFYKTFEDIIENELDFHGYGTPKIEI